MRDGGNLRHVGAVAPFQLISIFGANLGPAVGVAAPDGSSPSIGGVSVTFDGHPAQLLYVSASQINVAVPAPPPSQAVVPYPVTTVMQVKVNGSAVQRQFPFAEPNLNLFANLSSTTLPCANGLTGDGAQPVFTNADGSLNSCANPAKYGSAVSFFVHGVGAMQLGFPPPPQISGVQAFVDSCSAAVTNALLIDGFVYKVGVSLPPPGQACENATGGQGESFFQVTLSYNGVPAGPLVIPANLAGPVQNFSPPGVPMPMVIWVTP